MLPFCFSPNSSLVVPALGECVRLLHKILRNSNRPQMKTKYLMYLSLTPPSNV